MTVKVSREVKEMLLDGTTKPNPFEKVGYQHFLKYDRFKVTSKGIEFFYEGLSVFSMEHTANFASGDSLTVDRIEGRMQISLSD